MSLKKNIIANIVGKLWNLVSVFVFVPFYISFLGVESYGIISFYTMLLSFLMLADAGLTATLNREFAKDTSDHPNYRQNLLRTFEYIYMGLCAIVFLGTYLFAEDIARHFIKSETLLFEDIVLYVRMMGGIVVFSVFTSLYFGGLMGLQRQVAGNVLVIINSVVRAAVLIPLIWIPDLKLYFYWQIIVAAVYAFIVRWFVLTIIRTEDPIRANMGYLKNVWTYALGMMAMAFIAAGNSQVDKLIVSGMLKLTDFTNYSLAAMVGQFVLFIATPIIIAVFPELTRLVSIKDIPRTKDLFHKYSLLITIITSAIAMVVVCYTYDYILIWTHNQDIATSIQYATKILIIGNMFLALQFTPHYLALANGHTRTNVIIGVVVMVTIIPLSLLTIPKFGIIGAAIPWLVINVFATLYLGYKLITGFLRGEFTKWLVKDTVIPLVVSTSIATLFYWCFSFMPQGLYTLVYGIIIFISILIVNGIYFIKKYPEYKEHQLVKKLMIYSSK